MDTIQIPHDVLYQLLGEKDVQIRVLSLQLQTVTAERDALKTAAAAKDEHVSAER